MNRYLFLPLLCVLYLVLGGCRAEHAAGVLGALPVPVPGPVSVGTAAHVGAAVAKSAEDFTPEHEYYLGRAVAAGLLAQYPYVRNVAANDYLNLLGQGLARYSTMPTTYGGWHFLLLESAEVNAFAAPGGLILVTRGMVRCANNEDELAAVLAHEIAHVQLRHGVNSIKTSRRTDALLAIGSAAASAAPVPAGLGTLTGLFSGAVSDIIQTLTVNGYSRSAELEADRAALTILGQAGYSQAGLSAMLRNMEGRTGGGGFGKTHPSAADRRNALGVSGGVPADSVRQARFQAALGGLR